MSIYTYANIYQFLNITYVFSHMPPKTKGRQVNIFIPEGLYEEIIRVMEKANTWMNVQDFVRDAIIEKIEKYDKEHAV